MKTSTPSNSEPSMTACPARLKRITQTTPAISDTAIPAASKPILDQGMTQAPATLAAVIPAEVTPEASAAVILEAATSAVVIPEAATSVVVTPGPSNSQDISLSCEYKAAAPSGAAVFLLMKPPL